MWLFFLYFHLCFCCFSFLSTGKRQQQNKTKAATATRALPRALVGCWFYCSHTLAAVVWLCRRRRRCWLEVSFQYFVFVLCCCWGCCCYYLLLLLSLRTCDFVFILFAFVFCMFFNKFLCTSFSEFLLIIFVNSAHFAFAFCCYSRCAVAKCFNRIVVFLLQLPNRIAIKRQQNKNNLSKSKSKSKQTQKIQTKSKAKCAHAANATKCTIVDAWQHCRHFTTLLDDSVNFTKSKLYAKHLL